MTAQEFFYWLQGFIELSAACGVEASINPNVAACILSHADLVLPEQRGEGLIEVRTLAKMAARAGSAERTQSLTQEIVAVVTQVFLHVIDPKAGDAATQAELNEKHNAHLRPGPRPPGAPVMRC